MIKKFLLFFFTTIIILLFFLIYLSFVGIETNKFNTIIKNEIKSHDSRINIDLKKVKLHLNIKDLSIKIQTKDPVIIFDDRKINVEKISSNISIKSYLKNDFGIKNLLVLTKENKIKDLIYVVRSIENSPRLLILSQFIKKGKIKVLIDLQFDEKGKIKSNYGISGIVDKGKLQIFNFNTYDKIKFKFEYKSKNLKIKNLELNLDNTKFNSDLIEIKNVNSEYYFNGNLNNNKSNINLKLLNLISLSDKNLFKIENSKFENNSEFSFKLSKKLKIKDLSVNSKLIIYDLDYIDKINDLSNYLVDYKESIKFKKINLNVNYNKKNLKIIGKGKYKLNSNEDFIKLYIKKNKDYYDFDINIELDKSKLKIDQINYIKKSNQKANLHILGKYNLNKNIIFKKIVFSESKNNISIDDIKLNSKYKIINFKKVKFNYLTSNNIFNKFDIAFNNSNYTIKGKSYDAIKLIKNITDTEIKSNFFDMFEQINSKINVNLKKVYLDEKNIVNNFNGTLKLKKNKIIDLNLYSSFSENENFFITIKSLNSNQKVTTLFSDRAFPFVKNFKFIEGFENGVLDYNSTQNEKISKSQIKIYNFKVNKVPILAKLLTLASFQGIADLLTGEGIRFDEFEMNYSTKDNLITIDEIYSIGPSISILMEGYIQLNELISLRGTLVPATTVNKVIGKIKGIGNILVGKKKGEGIFGVSFKIKGPPKNLKTTVNPIKTLTPRFITRTLEKIKKEN